MIEAPFHLPLPAVPILRRAFLPSLALFGAAFCACAFEPSLSHDPKRPNVVLVTLDTTRPDHLGCYGYARDTSPRIDRLCREAKVFTSAYSTTSWTLPAHASLFTGTLPASHGADYDEDGPLLLSAVLDARSSEGHRVHGLSGDARTLALLSTERGYATGGFVGGPWMKRLFGLDRGFELWDDRGIDALNGRRAEALTDAALAWLRGLGSDRPFLLFLNYYDPHSPYEPPEGWRDVFLPGGAPPPGAPQDLQMATALYDSEIRYADHQLGRVFDALREGGAWDASWVVVTADHGDLLGEHGIAGHGRFLYEGEIRVPMIVKPPRGLELSSTLARLDAPIQLSDVMPMLADSIGFELPEAVLRTRAALSQGAGRLIVAELDPGPRHRARGSWKALIDGPDKFVWNSRGKHRLYDLARSAGEGMNRIGDEPVRSQQLERRLAAVLDALPDPPKRNAQTPQTIDDDTRRALEGLGYLDPSDPRAPDASDGGDGAH